jgi:hypothetical protein
MASATPTERALSAALNTGNTCPCGSNTDTMSTTWPSSGPGARKIRSARLPSAPPSTRPSATAHGAERSRRAIHAIQPTTARAITGKMKV